MAICMSVLPGGRRASLPRTARGVSGVRAQELDVTRTATIDATSASTASSCGAVMRWPLSTTAATRVPTAPMPTHTAYAGPIGMSRVATDSPYMLSASSATNATLGPSRLKPWVRGSIVAHPASSSPEPMRINHDMRTPPRARLVARGTGTPRRRRAPPARPGTQGTRPCEGPRRVPSGAMELRLDGKVARVTGASRGIGRAVSAAFSAAGAHVMLSSRKEDALEEARRELAPSASGELEVFAANAGDPDAARECVAATIERFGRLDVLVNNAATNPYLGRMIDIDLPRPDKTHEVNLRGPFVWIQEAWRQWMAEHGGNVINMSSIGGLSIETSLGHYNVTKAALLHLTRSLAKELAPGVRVNAIAPGLVKTDMARALSEPNEDAISRMLPLGRLGGPPDIANAALFLASHASSWVTGTTMVVDGGMLL